MSPRPFRLRTPPSIKHSDWNRKIRKHRTRAIDNVGASVGGMMHSAYHASP
ncbi:MAG TPA: hypothetical protein VNF92_10370 [Gemmatimonadaceae bacterium]|nr:hypothetical protein [Gemmatimonadaceae bacterium]